MNSEAMTTAHRRVAHRLLRNHRRHRGELQHRERPEARPKLRLDHAALAELFRRERGLIFALAVEGTRVGGSDEAGQDRPVVAIDLHAVGEHFGLRLVAAVSALAVFRVALGLLAAAYLLEDARRRARGGRGNLVAEVADGAELEDAQRDLARGVPGAEQHRAEAGVHWFTLGSVGGDLDQRGVGNVELAGADQELVRAGGLDARLVVAEVGVGGAQGALVDAALEAQQRPSCPR